MKCQKQHSQFLTVQCEVFSLLFSIWQRKTAVCHISGARSIDIFGILLEKWLNWLIDYQNSCQYHFFYPIHTKQFIIFTALLQSKVCFCCRNKILTKCRTVCLCWDTYFIMVLFSLITCFAPQSVLIWTLNILNVSSLFHIVAFLNPDEPFLRKHKPHWGHSLSLMEEMKCSNLSPSVQITFRDSCLCQKGRKMSGRCFTSGREAERDTVFKQLPLNLNL